jgi:hypothetical protein
MQVSIFKDLFWLLKVLITARKIHKLPRKPGIVAKIELRIPFQRPIRFLPETDYPRASRSFPRIAGSGNEIATRGVNLDD